MTPEQFCYWLQGFMEMTDRGREGGPVMGIDHTQTMMIRDHLDLVFNKVTPDRKKEKTAGQLLADEIDRAKHDRPGMTCTGGSSDVRIC